MAGLGINIQHVVGEVHRTVGLQDGLFPPVLQMKSFQSPGPAPQPSTPVVALDCPTTSSLSCSESSGSVSRIHPVCL